MDHGEFSIEPHYSQLSKEAKGPLQVKSIYRACKQEKTITFTEPVLTVFTFPLPDLPSPTAHARTHARTDIFLLRCSEAIYDWL